MWKLLVKLKFQENFAKWQASDLWELWLCDSEVLFGLKEYLFKQLHFKYCDSQEEEEQTGLQIVFCSLPAS